MSDFCVTAINKMTKEKVILTTPCTKEKAEAALSNLNVRKKDCPYTNAKVEVLPPKQLEIKF